jgi:hypothetical protein
MMAEKRSRHGLTALKVAVKVRGLNAIDGRTAAAQGLFAWRRELLAALGGESHVSPQKVAIVDLAVRTKLYVDHLDAFLMGRESLVDKKKRAIIPALRERQQLCDSLARLLSQLGLERVPAPVESLETITARIAARRNATTADGATETGQGAAISREVDAEAEAEATRKLFEEADEEIQ